jgi:hypothetical protein
MSYMIFSIKTILKGYILWIWYYLYKPYREQRKAEAERRMKICEDCEHLQPTFGTCELCYCIMKIKTKMWFQLDENGNSINGCVIKKW